MEAFIIPYSYICCTCT